MERLELKFGYIKGKYLKRNSFLLKIFKVKEFYVNAEKSKT